MDSSNLLCGLNHGILHEPSLLGNALRCFSVPHWATLVTVQSRSPPLLKVSGIRQVCYNHSLTGTITINRGLLSQLSRITLNPEQCGGRPCIRVEDILDLLAAGASHEEILTDYPYLEQGDISAALEYAAA